MNGLQTAILERLGTDAGRIQLRLYDTVSSTNTLLREAAEQGAPEGTVILSRAQTAGKGRQGRQFYSPSGTGLYLSVLLRPALRPDALSELTPMAAVAAAEAAEACAGEPVQIKWVNDLLLHGKKVCGILAETQFSGEDYYVVLGIGINLLAPSEGYPPELRGTAGAVCPPGTDPDSAFVQCAAVLLRALLREYDGLAEKAYLAGYRQRLCVLGKEITACENGIERAATALDIDDRVRLLVRWHDDGSTAWRATGEIRIRL